MTLKSYDQEQKSFYDFEVENQKKEVTTLKSTIIYTKVVKLVITLI